MPEDFLNDTVNSWNFSSMDTLPQSVLPNASLGCQVMNSSHMEYLSWDNPDNIITVEVQKTIRIIKNYVLVFLFMIGGPSNVINMAVFYKQGLKDRVNLCLFALALADGLHLTLAMFYHAEQVYIQLTTNGAFGPLTLFLTNNHFTCLLGHSFVSLVLSAIIASERCLCVLYPLKVQVMMHTRTMAVIILFMYITIMSLFFIVSFRFQLGCVYDTVSGLVTKTTVMGEFYRTHKQLLDHLDGFVFGSGLPTATVVVVLTTTIVTVVKLRQIVTWRAGKTSSLSPREIALTKMLVGNSILFLVCTFPRSVLRLSWLFFPEINSGGRHHNFYLASVWHNEILGYINASVNIIVYYVMGSRYREVLKTLFVKKPRRAK